MRTCCGGRRNACPGRTWRSRGSCSSPARRDRRFVEEANSRHATAIVLGLSHRRVYGDYELGATAAYVLKHAQCQVLVVREPEREGDGQG
ncbi:MAG: universal stress protein [Dehalococcoidia bacterium]|nr:universal stress protein [Dehalococcoidia bacterium]